MIPIAPPEAQPMALDADVLLDADLVADPSAEQTDQKFDELARPFRLGLIGLGIALGLFTRLLVANGYGELISRPMTLAAGATSALIGIGLMMIASERDRVGAPLMWLTGVTALAWGTLNWISPPFAETTLTWSTSEQTVLSVLGVGNGLLLAGIVTLAFVRRAPTLTVAVTLVAAVFALAANSVLVQDEWPAIGCLGVAFALTLLAWDRSPRREQFYAVPTDSPRISRAALSLAVLAFCGTAIQLWLSRDTIPRALIGLIAAAVLIIAAFASMIRVRRELERRETTLSEWTSWMREIRSNDFRAEMQNFESTPPSGTPRYEEPGGAVPQEPRELSFPNLTVPGEPLFKESPDLADSSDSADITPVPTYVESDLADELPPLSIDDELAAAAAADEAAFAITIPTSDTTQPEPTPPKPTQVDQSPEALPEPAELEPHPASLLPRVDVVADTAPVTQTTTPLSSGLPVADTAPQLAASAAPAQAVSTSGLPVADTAPPAPTAAVVPSTTAEASGIFSTMLAAPDQAPVAPTETDDFGFLEVNGLDALEAWRREPGAELRPNPLLVAIEVMALNRYDALSDFDKEGVQMIAGALLTEAVAGAELIALIDGPYMIVADGNVPNSELAGLNTTVRAKLQERIDLETGTEPLGGTLAFLRPAAEATLDEIVDQAVIGLVRARQAESAAAPQQ